MGLWHTTLILTAFSGGEVCGGAKWVQTSKLKVFGLLGGSSHSSKWLITMVIPSPLGKVVRLFPLP